MRSPGRVACYVFASLAAAWAVAGPPPKEPAAAPPARCTEAEDLVARGLALEFEAPCHAECMRQKAYFYGRATALCPTNAAAQNNLGNLYEAAGQLDDAKERYHRALAAKQDFAPALFGLGDIALVEGQYPQAIGFYERGLALEPADPASTCRLDVAHARAADRPPDRAVIGRCLAEAGARSRGPDPILVPAARLAVQLRFAEGSAALDRRAREQLAELEAALRTGELATARFVIEGHADATEAADPTRLSAERAEQVRGYLVERRIDAARLTVKAWGAACPAVAAGAAGAHAANRRVEVVRVGDGGLTVGGPGLHVDATVVAEDEQARLEPVRAGTALPSGGRYAIRFLSRTPAHVYVVQEDAAGKVTALFPNRAFSQGRNPVQRDVDYVVPDDDRLFQLDDTVGRERVYIVATRTPARDLEDVMRRLKGPGQGEPAHEMVLQIRSRGVAGVVAPSSPSSAASMRDLFAAAGKCADDTTLTVIEFEHVPRRGGRDVTPKETMP
jgi:outer membrane protein OmpA-like peptidoglycan-associated protein